MRNILLIQLETKVAIGIILIVIIIFMVTIFKSVDNFNKFINQQSLRGDYEKARIQKNP